MHIILLLISIVFTEDITNDSLSVIIKERTNLILEEVYIDPLEDKKFGIELSPLYSMFVHDGLSGSFSNFNLSDVAEITFPFSYRTYRRKNDEGKMEDRYLTYLDAQYRFFLGKHRIGRWIGTGFRFCLDEDNSGSYSKSGISFGFGTRIFSKKGWYWGSSLYIGKYYFGEKDRGDSAFFQVELFKFGFAI
jgi:hypothetical protein